MARLAYAQGDTNRLDSECAQQLHLGAEIVQDRVDNNALSEADQEKVYALMDEADALCTEGKSDKRSRRSAPSEDGRGPVATFHGVNLGAAYSPFRGDPCDGVSLPPLLGRDYLYCSLPCRGQGRGGGREPG